MLLLIVLLPVLLLLVLLPVLLLLPLLLLPHPLSSMSDLSSDLSLHLHLHLRLGWMICMISVEEVEVEEGDDEVLV